MNNPPTNDGLGAALRILRKEAGLRLADVSKLSGASINYLSRAENGLVAPSPTWVHNVVAAIGQTLASKDAA